MGISVVYRYVRIAGGERGGGKYLHISLVNIYFSKTFFFEYENCNRSFQDILFLINIPDIRSPK